MKRPCCARGAHSRPSRRERATAECGLRVCGCGMPGRDCAVEAYGDTACTDTCGVGHRRIAGSYVGRAVEMHGDTWCPRVRVVLRLWACGCITRTAVARPLRRTALRPCSAQTATVAHAAWGGGRTHGTAAMLSPDRHSRTCGVGKRSHARPCGHAQLRPPQSHLRRRGGGRTHGTAAMLSPDRHSRTCGAGERSHARHCGHAQLRLPQSHLRRRGAVARTPCGHAQPRLP